MAKKYKVITLCGSTKFKKEFQEIQKKLTLEGNIVISVGLFGHSGDSEVWENSNENTVTETKKMLDEMHKRKIDMSDEIFVIDVGGYIGESTKSEISYAERHNKPVRYYSQEISSDDEFAFQKLTPTDNADLTTYEDALDFVFENKNKDIQNIAVTGIYGSGKSSVINTYERTHKKRFIHISLSHFEGVENEENEEILEKKIVNQLVQQIPGKLIPETQFKTKKEFCWQATVLQVLGIVLIGLLGIYFVRFDAISDAITAGNHQILDKFTTIPCLLFAILLFSVLLSIFLVQLIRWQSQNHIISKIAIKGNEMELADNKEDKSYFNRHIDEILYVLEKITTAKGKDRFDGIVVEDLDRFEEKIDTQIFEKLRELCVLGNRRIKKNTDKKKDKNPSALKFFYLLSDDTFLSKERTKFFDYIIPIIPVVDSSNSYAKIKHELKKAGYDGKIDDHFLRGLSLYFDDYRLIKNIINEFQIYAKKLKNIEHNYNELLAIVVYKNYFPKDFAELQLHSGCVNTIFDKRSVLVEKEKGNLNFELEKAKDRLTALNNEMLSNERELHAVKLDRQQYMNLAAYKDYSYNDWDKVEFPKRSQAIKDKVANKEKEIREDIVKLQTDLIHVNNKKFNKLITEKNKKEVFYLSVGEHDKISDFDDYILSVQNDKYFGIIEYLILSGYLDDVSYRDYMACFDENGMSISDKNFLIGVQSRNGKDFNYLLNSPALVFDNLKDDDFLIPATRNYMLIDYVIRNKKSHSFELFILQLKENKDVDFISQYLRNTKHYNEFISKTCKLWDGFLDLIISNENETMLLEERQRVVLTVLCVCSEEIIKNQNNIGVLERYIEDDLSEAICEDDKAEIIAEKLKTFDIEIQDLDSQIGSEKLREMIVQKSLYALNIVNLQSILRKELACNEEVLRVKFLSSLIEGNDSDVAGYMDDNLGEVVGIIVENYDSQTDDPDIVAKVSNSNTDDNVISEYLQMSDTIIEDISKVNSKYWKILAEKHTFGESIDNILMYFEEYKMDTSLVQFLNSANINENIDFSSEPDRSNDLWLEVYKNNGISDDVYLYLVEQIGREISNFNTICMEENKCRILIEHKLIPMNQNTITFLRAHYKSLMHDFICSDIGNYIVNVKGAMYSIDEVKGILEETIVKEEDKIKLLNMTTDVISVADKKLSDLVFINIIENHFDSNDLQYLAEKFEKYNAECKSVIYKKIVENRTQLSNIAGDASISLLTKIFGDKSISLLDKVGILDVLFKKEKPNDVIAKLLNAAGEDVLARLFIPGRSRMSLISNDAGHKRLLGVLKDNGIIKGFSEENEGEFFKIKR